MKGRTILAIGALGTLAFIVYNFYQRNRKHPLIFLRKNLAKNYNARTIPPFGIYIKESEKDNEELLQHELVHWKQYQKKGLLNFYTQYAKEIKQYGYDRMPMEKEARENETEYCKENYTECVRKGDSNTIFDTNFRR